MTHRAEARFKLEETWTGMDKQEQKKISRNSNGFSELENCPDNNFMKIVLEN